MGRPRAKRLIFIKPKSSALKRVRNGVPTAPLNSIIFHYCKCMQLHNARSQIIIHTAVMMTPLKVIKDLAIKIHTAVKKKNAKSRDTMWLLLVTRFLRPVVHNSPVGPKALRLKSICFIMLDEKALSVERSAPELSLPLEKLIKMNEIRMIEPC